jgi:nucleoside-diphosphate-sugar epimerase
MSKERNRIIEQDVVRIVEHALPWSAFSGKKILIAGANGFLPAYLVETLLYLNEIRAATGCKVIALARNARKAEARFAHLFGRPDFSILIQYVCAPIVIDDRVDLIIHAASQASPKYYGTDPVGTLAANTLGTHNLLSLARQCAVQDFLFFSSGEVYGRVEKPELPTAEDGYGYLDPTNVRSCYGESKRLGETMCVAWSHQYGIPVKIVRPSHTYGPGMALDDGRVFADFVANVVRREDILVKSSGTARRPFCYIADAMLGYLTVLLEGQDSQQYNVVNQEFELKITTLATILANLFPERRLGVKFLPGFGPSGSLPNPADRGRPDTSKLRALDWHPETDVHEGFRRTVLSYEC